MKKNERGFFGKLIIVLLTLWAWIGVIAMGCCVLSSYIDPVHFVWLSFFGLSFWPIFIYNVILLVLLLLMWSKSSWVAVLAIAIGVIGVIKSFSMGKSQEGAELRVMSYNVQNFHHLYDKKKAASEVAYDIAKFVQEKQPDVLCLQEFTPFLPNASRKNCIIHYGVMMGLPYYYYHDKTNFAGNVIFSKYPVKAVDDPTPFGEENMYGAVAQIDAGEKGKFNVVCCHLTSNQLTNDEIAVISNPSNNKEEVQEYGKSILSKLKSAYEKRSYEVCKMLADMPTDGRPIILCGDMNDTPISYTYQQLKRAGFVDGFVVAGRGIGHTYAGKLPLLRIDYIWGNDKIQPMGFQRIRFKGSDHYPVIMDFKIGNGF